jgi:cytoskeletal protein CcmA (bactofilin family)
MFRKGQENVGSAASSLLRIGEQQPMRSKNVSVIGPTLVFKGELSADEDLVIEGTIEGTIAHHKKNLTIGKSGRVTADIHASSVLVEGELNGDIHSDGLVSLANGAMVIGNVYCTRIVMEDGARFNGKIEMAIPSPLKVAPEQEEVEEELEEEFADVENLTA